MEKERERERVGVYMHVCIFVGLLSRMFELNTMSWHSKLLLVFCKLCNMICMVGFFVRRGRGGE